MKDPMVMVTSRKEIVDGFIARSFASMQARLVRAYDEIEHTRARVRSLSPQATLDRGYSVVQKIDGTIVRSPDSLTKGDKLKLRLAKGVALATAEGSEESAPKKGE
jgi:exodeoxyribonuclease VII large subunit